jgi:hypothetical protein
LIWRATPYNTPPSPARDVLFSLLQAKECSKYYTTSAFEHWHLLKQLYAINTLCTAAATVPATGEQPSGLGVSFPRQIVALLV